MADSIIVTSKLKEHINGRVNLGSDVVEALDLQVKKLVDKAINRATFNGRKTLGSKDL